eukprot:scaffold1446_cov391-Prasinococcus_capsulatus_cf.AAC.14
MSGDACNKAHLYIGKRVCVVGVRRWRAGRTEGLRRLRAGGGGCLRHAIHGDCRARCNRRRTICSCPKFPRTSINVRIAPVFTTPRFRAVLLSALSGMGVSCSATFASPTMGHRREDNPLHLPTERRVDTAMTAASLTALLGSSLASSNVRSSALRCG